MFQKVNPCHSAMSNGVPAALQNAMNGPQDSKPFTYLPGGLDFSEIRSPRMAKRLAKHQVFSGLANGNTDQKVKTTTKIFL